MKNSASQSGLVYAMGSTFGPEGEGSQREGADLAGQGAGGLIVQRVMMVNLRLQLGRLSLITSEA